ncbi:MAG: AbrB/MazE/SpoVT family DNA-binding domain-containing protein [Methylobacteriaceae bacterium]|nr:AbrB/MazE/SpoVT family DNA-binding domain-containing protein [Methylobacteriaceae bacterium]MBV9218814.1 AbrB/MazE/SpoVT family DNA-binding domain-containing protein [Methylobacteriaceae bacterium]MBV9244700.1 AbrB/MazE/SpoVT family DNA-binding domain-containing protein [Methylobacteriaceae bacterium]MBV9636001.1 AbrB/MazE/SpoVT family DNA-binding domain-containing protein [Methylobacteriaceae bacterium]MBV9702261.1 AbrB/MazE/SpoVT family DNA-binding domain-containing protein [Methylobacteri
MSAATVTSKGQITIPASVRNRFGIEPGHQLVFFERLDGKLGVRVRKPRRGSGYGMLQAYGEGLAIDELRAVVGQAVADGVAERLERASRTAESDDPE